MVGTLSVDGPVVKGGGDLTVERCGIALLGRRRGVALNVECDLESLVTAEEQRSPGLLAVAPTLQGSSQRLRLYRNSESSNASRAISAPARSPVIKRPWFLVGA